MSDVWNPTQYHLFQSERQQPFFDLLSMVRRLPRMRVIDLGCGTGELTAHLHLALQAEHTLGIDNSPAMLAKCAEHRQSGLDFAMETIGEPLAAGAFDLVFSNAAVQWVSNHPRLLRQIRAALRPHGQIAIQMPANFDHPSHRIAIEVADEEPFRSALGSWRREIPVLPVEDYARLLWESGFETQSARVQVYTHRLRDSGAVVEWVKGTLLTDYQKRLEPDLFEAFLRRYRERLLAEIGLQAPFLYTFKRILLWGQLQ